MINEPKPRQVAASIRAYDPDTVPETVPEIIPKVASQLTSVKRGQASAEATIVQTEIDRLRAEDNATAYVYEDGDDTTTSIMFFRDAERR